MTTILPPAVVVVAHGPSKATRAAVGRARGLVRPGGEVMVVAGTEPGEAALTGVRKAATVVPGRGPDAFADAVRRCGERAILVVHDDVLVLPGSVQQLYLGHLRTGRLVVAATDDADTDHHHVSVDRADAAALRFLEASGRLHERPVRRVRLSCAVAGRDELLALAERGGAAPGLVHEAAADGWIVARGAVARHQGSCASRLVAGDPPDGRPLLVAGMIVRDEADLLDDCLASLRGVVDRVEIADTGSTDATVEIARAHGAVVESIPWRDDFGWARNQVLARCTDAHYLLWIDADERFRCEDPVALRRLLATYRELYPAFRLEVRNLVDSGEAATTFRVNRIVRPQGTQFVGSLHEQPRPVDPAVVWPLMDLSLCRIDHLGYGAALVDERAKLDRNLEIARRQWEQRGDAQAALHYLRSLDAARQDPIETLAALDSILPDPNTFPAAVQAYLGCLRASRLRSLGRLEAALDHATRALDLVPGDDRARYLVAELLVASGRADEVPGVLSEPVPPSSPQPAFADLDARAQQRAVLVRALAATDRVDLALATVVEGGLPVDFDPWVPILHACRELDAEALLPVARAAARIGATRFAPAACELVAPSRVAAVLREFCDAGGDPQLVVALQEVAREHETALATDEGWSAFEAAPSAAAALRYATAAVADHADLAADLAELDGGPDGGAGTVGGVLGIAAVAHERRGDPARAERDATTALAHDPGAVRAAAVLARRCLALGDPAGALAAANGPFAGGPLPVAVRDELANAVASAHARLGSVPRAIEALLPVISEGGSITCWADLARAAADDVESATLLVGAAVAGDGTEFIAAIADTLRPDVTAELCVAYLFGGGACPDAVSTGMLAALVRSRMDLVELLVGSAHLVERGTRSQLADRVLAAGRPDLAEQVREVVPSS